MKTPAFVLACRVCGALVAPADIDFHERWHRTLTNVPARQGYAEEESP